MLIAFGALVVFGTQAMAADGYGRRSARANHDEHHDDLDHRGFHRELEHRNAHRYPMTGRQHGRLHDNLDHEAYHDRLEHRGAHRNRAYSPYQRYGYGAPPRYGYRYGPYNSFGYYGQRFSFRFGF